MNLKTSFDGLTLKNPLMPASGPLVGDDEKQQRSDQLGDEGRYIASVGTLYERIIETVS